MPLKEVSDEISSVLARCLEKQRENRWQRMSSVLIELKLATTSARHAQQAAEWKEKMSSQRAHIAGLDERLTAHQELHQQTAAELREQIRNLEANQEQQSAELAKANQAIAALEDSVASLQRTTQAHAQAIEAIEAASAQTDEVVEHVVDAVGMMHRAMVERTEPRAVAVSNNGN